MVNVYSTRSVGVFFRRAKLQIRGGNEASQRGRERGREERREREYVPPTPPPFFLSPYFPQSFSVIKSKNEQTAFHACTAG